MRPAMTSTPGVTLRAVPRRRDRPARGAPAWACAVAAAAVLLGPPADPAAAGQLPAGLLERAENGEAAAQNEVGSRYYAGRGVERDDAEASRWIRRAAEQGYAPAQYNLGLLHFRNRGVAGSDAEAARWYRAAAVQGYAPAQAGLGYLHIYGAGVEQDHVLAYMWLELARRGAADDFTRRLYEQRRDELRADMTADDIREARRRADAWRPDHGAPQPSHSSIIRDRTIDCTKRPRRSSAGSTRAPNALRIRSRIADNGVSPSHAFQTKAPRSSSRIR